MTDQINLGLVWADLGGVTPVNATKYEGGWVAEIPTYQNFNYMVQGIDQNLLHFAENGSYGWEDNINYQVGAVVLQGGNIYRCKTAHNADKLTPQDPTTDATNSYWVTGNIVGDTLDQLSEYEGFAIKLTERAGTTWTGQDITIKNGIPIISMETIGATNNFGFANVSGFPSIVEMDQVSSPDGRSLTISSPNVHKIFHEGNPPAVGSVVGALGDAPVDGSSYARKDSNWVKVTGATVSETPPTVTNENEGWFNLGDGQLYLWINDGDTSQWVPASPTTVPVFGDPDKEVGIRNGAATTGVVSQANVLKAGFCVDSMTGNGTFRNALTSVDSTQGAFVWIKSHGTEDHALYDTVRGVNKSLKTNGTNSGLETTDVDALVSFNTDGFSLGSNTKVNDAGVVHTSLHWNTTKSLTGTSTDGFNHVVHANPELGFSMIHFDGSGRFKESAHPHLLGGEPELVLTKNTEQAHNWTVHSKFVGNPGSGTHLLLNRSDSVITQTQYSMDFDKELITYGDAVEMNELNDACVSYCFRSVEGVSKVGLLNFQQNVPTEVNLGFRPAFLLIKRVDGAGSAGDWDMVTTQMSSNTKLEAQSNGGLTSGDWTLTSNGFTRTTTAVGGEFIYLAMAETVPNDLTDRYKTLYKESVNPTTLDIKANALLTYANGFNLFGQEDTSESVPSGTTVSLGAGFEDKQLWLYKDLGGSYGFNEFKPTEGEDNYGREPNLISLTGQRLPHYVTQEVLHLNSDTSSGRVWSSPSSASSEKNAFMDNDSDWVSDSVTGNFLAYTHSEPRVLKSWRYQSGSSSTYSPTSVRIEGSNDGTTWVDMDGASMPSPTANKWLNIEETPANTTAYLHHRLLIVGTVGGIRASIKRMEFNTAPAGDIYSVAEGVMRNPSGTPIQRIYLAKVTTDENGEVVTLESMGESKSKLMDVEVHGKQTNRGDLEVDGNIINPGAAVAWVAYDANEVPPKILGSYNVSGVVDSGTGKSIIHFTEPMENGNYLVTGSVGSTTGGGILYSNDGDYGRNLYRLEVMTKTIPGDFLDYNKVMVVVYGGKNP